ncbi:MAG TPA: DNA-directed RNA polymerase subunit alpha C-terminal domain-containing protein [Anaerolineaceae bacterium]|nr:DNA-directed RNA polymerase subunit alpha C-terminal domain-containing protein [Anaerolineaceae bacterium]
MDRFYKRLQARQDYVETKKTRETERVSPQRQTTELELGTRPTDALVKAGLTNVGQILERLAQGEAALLEVEGFGRKSLIDLKKKLRSLGYELPAAAEDVAV